MTSRARRDSVRDVSGYTKLFNSILASTVWETELHVRVVWVSMLAMCDRYGEVHASLPGLAKIAGVTREQAEDAVRILSAPDHDSRTKEHEGRRIEPIDGGWEVLNYAKYREKQSEDEQRAKAAERQARKRKRDHEKSRVESRTVTESNGASREVTSSHDKQRQSAEADLKQAEATPPVTVQPSLFPASEPSRSVTLGTRVKEAWLAALAVHDPDVTPQVDTVTATHAKRIAGWCTQQAPKSQITPEECADEWVRRLFANREPYIVAARIDLKRVSGQASTVWRGSNGRGEMQPVAAHRTDIDDSPEAIAASFERPRGAR